MCKFKYVKEERIEPPVIDISEFPNNIWFIADTHFWHSKIIHLCNRPFRDALEMYTVLKDNWNKSIAPGDTVFILGDLGFLSVTRGREIVESLNGYKILILGNHDESPNQMYNMHLDEVHHEYMLKYKEHLFRLSHFPYKPSLWIYIKCYLQQRYIGMKDKNPSKGIEDYLIHGHVHNNNNWSKKKRDMINVGVDVWDFKPVHINEIITLVNKKEIK